MARKFDLDLDWREILLGVLVGVCAAVVGAFVTVGLMHFRPSNIMQVALTYFPAGFWAGVRANRGLPILNALASGGILLLISATAYALLGTPPITTAGELLVQVLFTTAIVTIAGAIAYPFRSQRPT